MALSRSRVLIWNMSHSLTSEHPPANRSHPDRSTPRCWVDGGRIAARYRMSVQAFEATCELDLQTPDGQGWLLMPELQQHAVDRLAALTRISRDRIKDIWVPPPWEGPRSTSATTHQSVI